MSLYPFTTVRELAFHVPAFQGNHIEKAGTFFPGMQGLAHASLSHTLVALAQHTLTP
jgi:hypothetical protein